MQIKIVMSGLLVSLSVLIISGCVLKTEEAHIPPHSPKGEVSKLSSIPPQMIYIQSVKDYRDVAGGERESVGVRMGDVVFVPQAVSIIKDVVVSEFEHAGHRFSDSEHKIILTVKVRNFDTSTDSTMTYWDINGTTNIEIDVSDQKGNSQSFSYSSKCSDRTYVYPSAKLFEGVMLDCIDGFAGKLRNDQALVEAMQKIGSEH